MDITIPLTIIHNILDALRVKDRFLDIRTIRKRVECEGREFLTKTLPKLGKALQHALSAGHFICPSEFSKETRKGALPKLFGSLLKRVFDVNGKLKSQPCPEAIAGLMDLCFMSYKVRLGFSDEQKLENAMDFIETDNSVFDLDQIDPLFVQKLKQYTGSYFSAFDIGREFVGAHGPGTVADCEIYCKSNSVCNNPDLAVAIGASNDAPFVMPHVASRAFQLSNNDTRAVVMYERINRSSPDGFSPFVGDVTKNKSEVLFVEKDSRGPRVISREPWANQFFQQGVGRNMRSFIESHPQTKGYVNFTDQSVNYDLAALSSVTGDLATLDLSKASDLVSNALVMEVFSKLPLLRHLLEVSRTAVACLDGYVGSEPHRLEWYIDNAVYEQDLTPDEIDHKYQQFCGKNRKTEVALKKFAPMGSALCFPVMAYLIYATLRITYCEFVRRDPCDNRPVPIYVYGDDIIVPTAFAKRAVIALHSIGLRVNTGKSFYKGRFRESCGIEAFNGSNITPNRLKYLPVDASRKSLIQPSPLSTIIAYANNTRYRAVYFALHRLCAARGVFMPFAPPESAFLAFSTSSADWLEESILDPIAGRAFARTKLCRNHSPFGVRLKAYFIRSNSVHKYEHPYAHLERVLPRLGIYGNVMPELGEFSEFRSARITTKGINVI